MRKFLYLLFTINPLIAIAQSAISVEKKVDSIFSEYTIETPGVAVAIVKDGKVVFKKGYGASNLEYGIPISVETKFNIGSVAKQFTAFAIYLLAREGKISLEDDVKEYVFELPDYGKTVKIKHLLSHTSGLRDQWALLTLAGWRMDDVITTNQILNLVSRQNELNFPTGTQFMYSNTGYTLAAEIIRRVRGKSFVAYTKENIFKPLGMNNTEFVDDYEKVILNRAYSYEKENNRYIKKKLNYSTVGPTGLYTTVEDLAKWVNNFNDPTVVNDKLLKEYNKISTYENGQPVIWSAQPNDTVYHAKGQLHYYHQGVKVISHGGHDAGFRATLTRFPDNGLAIIALSNDEHYNMFGNLMSMAEIYLKDEFKETEALPAQQKEPNEIKFKKPNLKEYEGSFKNEELLITYVLKEEDSILQINHHRLGKIELRQIGEDKFSGINTFPFELHFVRRENKINHFEVSNFGVKNLKFYRIENNTKQIPQVALVDKQLAAYNNRDLPAFLSFYDPDIEIYNFPNRLSGKGHDFMKNIYSDLFQESPYLRCEIQNRLVLENTVIDYEKVYGFRGKEFIEVIAIYIIQNGKINQVHFISKE